MYPHNIEAQQIDVVQIEAPEYNPDIDGDKESHTENRPATVSVQNILDDNHNIPDLIDDNSTNPDTITTYQDSTQTDWPDTPTIQILWVSSTTTDLPPKVTYYRCTILYTVDGEEIPQLEEEEVEQDHPPYIDNFTTHHKTH